MKDQYLRELIRQTKTIDPRIDEKPIQGGRGVTFYGPSGNISGRATQKFFRIEDIKGKQFAGKYYSLESQERIRVGGLVEKKKRSPENLKAEPFKFMVGDDTKEIIEGARKSFELLLQRK